MNIFVSDPCDIDLMTSDVGAYTKESVHESAHQLAYLLWMQLIGGGFEKMCLDVAPLLGVDADALYTELLDWAAIKNDEEFFRGLMSTDAVAKITE